jgi:hypothetical protein
MYRVSVQMITLGRHPYESPDTSMDSMLRSLARRLLLPIVALVASASLGGCLLIESKEYLFLVREDGSGQARITFENIMSVQESDNEDEVTKDYTQLLTDYVKGKRFEQENPSYYNVKKRLFEKDGKLNAEVTFDFLSYEDVGLFRLDGKGPWMFHAGALNQMSAETFESSNGTHGGRKMPVVFWSESTAEFKIRTQFEEPEKGVTRSLLPLYKRIGTN